MARIPMKENFVPIRRKPYRPAAPLRNKPKGPTSTEPIVAAEDRYEVLEIQDMEYVNGVKFYWIVFASEPKTAYFIKAIYADDCQEAIEEFERYYRFQIQEDTYC